MSFNIPGSSICLVAEEDVQVALVDRNALVTTLSSKPELAIKFFRLLASQMANKLGEAFL